MTACEVNYSKSNFLLSRLETVIEESENQTNLLKLNVQKQDRIFSNLQAGFDVTKAKSLLSNLELASQGFVVGGSGFIIKEQKKLKHLEPDVVHPFITGRDLTQNPKTRYAIDVNHLSEQELISIHPKTYQWLLETVKPERDINNDPKLRREWWRYRRANSSIRNGIKELNKYIATTRTAKHRVFQFVSSKVMAESGIVMIFLDDAYFLGVLSSNLHILWSLSQGSTLEDRPVYNHAYCFDRFPFPTPTEIQKQNIRELGERLDSHRKKVQAKYPDITITGMYNILEKIKNNQTLTDKDQEYNNRALVSTLKQIHDELDAAVFDAYGWSKDITDEEILANLVKLNAERPEEERNGLIRWLRPEYQAPKETTTQRVIKDIKTPETEPIAPVEQQKWAKTFKEQLAAIRAFY